MLCLLFENIFLPDSTFAPVIRFKKNVLKYIVGNCLPKCENENSFLYLTSTNVFFPRFYIDSFPL